MNNLVSPDGSVRYGLYDSPLDRINYEDYRLETPMGRSVPGILKKIKINQFVFFGIAGREFISGMAIVDLKYLATAFLYVYDRKTGNLIETKKTALPLNVSIEPYPDRGISVFDTDALQIEIENGNVFAECDEIALNVKLDLINTNPLRLCTRAGYSGWIYTQKTTPVRLAGEIQYENKQISISSPACMAVIDWTAGYMRRQTFWNWVSTACVLPDGRTLGFNFSWGVNETGFTENAFWVDGKMTKADTVSFVFNRNHPYGKWRITSNDRKVDLVFSPETHRREKINILILASKFTQFMGTFEGRLITDDEEVIHISACPGWAEDHYAKW